MLLSDILRELLYSVIPIIFYFIAKEFSEDDVKIFFMVVFMGIFFVVLMGILDLFHFPFPDAMQNALAKKGKANFISYYSAISMGYVAQLVFALLLFDVIKFQRIIRLKKPLILLFFGISILTLQRSSFLGIIVALVIYIYYHGSKKIKKTFTTVIFVLLVFFMLISLDLSQFFGFDVGKYIIDEIEEFNIHSVANARASQAYIYNDENLFYIMFGEGFGKYSPNNTLTIRKMPDVSYVRIYNELGFVGGILFFIPFVLILIQAMRKKDSFMIYFVSFTLIAFFFNRIVWMIPLNYLIYSILGCYENRNIIWRKYIKVVNL
ncbi:MAG: hypothetical protein PHI90_07600 [Clostridia bacterium]|nr:hypothetical protein [Clostridia bacterium]